LTTLAGITDHEEQDENTQEGKSVDSFSRDVKHTNKMPQWTKKKEFECDSSCHHLSFVLAWTPAVLHIGLPLHSNCQNDGEWYRPTDH
jgi:hypothetical protein